MHQRLEEYCNGGFALICLKFSNLEIFPHIFCINLNHELKNTMEYNFNSYIKSPNCAWIDPRTSNIYGLIESID